jgi:regulator of nucleoside diphosphate kinase
LFLEDLIVRQDNIIISSDDRDRLLKLTDSARLDRRVLPQHLDALERELARADIVESAALPRDVVSMGSTVWFRDLDADEVERYTLVFPHEADVVRNRISVLAPVGTALLGYRLRDIVEWPVPQGKRRLEITKVFQPRTTRRAEPAEALV